jgi:hypothetical protein
MKNLNSFEEFLNESQLNEATMENAQYLVSAKGGKIVIQEKKSGKTLAYTLSVKKFGFWKSIDVADFPGGNSIKLTGLGMSKTIPFALSDIAGEISSNWNKEEIKFSIEGWDIKFTKA